MKNSESGTGFNAAGHQTEFEDSISEAKFAGRIGDYLSFISIL